MAQRRPPEHTQRQFDRRTWSILGLSILIILAFSATIPTLYLALARSGFLGDNLPAGGGWVLLVGLVGLTSLFCLYMINQQAAINRLRDRMVNDQMELEQSRGRLAELTSLFQLGNSLHMELPLETILEITVRRVASTLHSHDVSLFLYDPDTKTLSVKGSFGLAPRDPEPDVKLGEGAVGWAARHREPIMMQQKERDARFSEFFTSHPEVGSVLILPIALESRTLAVMQVCRAVRAEPFRLEHRDIGQLFAENVASVLDRAWVMDRLRRTTTLVAAAAAAPPAGSAGEFRDGFLGAAAAELKSPLTSIVAYSEVLDLNDKKMTPSMRHEFTGRLRSEAQRLMALVDDVLDLVRLDLGRYLLELHVANVNDAVRAAVDAVRLQADAKSIAIETVLDQRIPDQHLDPGKMRQSIANVLRNGIRFSPMKSHIRIATWLRDDGVVVEIKDAGPPVPVESSSSVFELEHAADEENKRCKDGLGFGLHLTKRFVELHGGSVSAGPDPTGGGAAFWIRLPRGEDISHMVVTDPFAGELAKG
ncbi:MAG TPA: ATP-binding protein [Candidatus Limnocylindrales bacterium]|nr:ATP-binding protein [Candidatus Limnocylindrales bacterium]